MKELTRWLVFEIMSFFDISKLKLSWLRYKHASINITLTSTQNLLPTLGITGRAIRGWKAKPWPLTWLATHLWLTIPQVMLGTVKTEKAGRFSYCDINLSPFESSGTIFFQFRRKYPGQENCKSWQLPRRVRWRRKEWRVKYTICLSFFFNANKFVSQTFSPETPLKTPSHVGNHSLSYHLTQNTNWVIRAGWKKKKKKGTENHSREHKNHFPKISIGG